MTDAAEREVRTWIQDQLHALLGFADANVAAFLLSISRKHTNEDSLFTDLKRSCNLPNTREVHAFAAELLRRAPRRSAAATNAGRLQHQLQARELVRKSATYGLLEGDEDDQDDEGKAAGPVPGSGGGSAQPPSQSQTQSHSQQQKGDNADGRRHAADATDPEAADGAGGGKHLRSRRVKFADGGGGGGDNDDDDTTVHTARRPKRKWELEEEEDERQEDEEQRQERLKYVQAGMNSGDGAHGNGMRHWP